MPRWERHSGNWFNFRSRYDVGSRIGEVLTGIIPTARTDIWWHPDFFERSYAAGAQAWDVVGDNIDTGAGVVADSILASGFQTCAFHNPIPADDPRSSVECLVYAVEGFFAKRTTGSSWDTALSTTSSGPLRLFTGFDAYFTGGGTNVFTRSNQGGTGVGILGAFMSSGTGPELDQLRLPNAHIDVGYCSERPAVSIGGILQNALGPWMPGNVTTAGSHSRTLFRVGEGVAPFRVKPGQFLVVQNYDDALASVLGTAAALFANFYWVERPWKEPLP